MSLVTCFINMNAPIFFQIHVLILLSVILFCDIKKYVLIFLFLSIIQDCGVIIYL